ncbi:uncharacterized protein LOC126668351 [Mercurialis annua]|uniref:uncharacterized protein LOC126668351 n=1 Tax=Mercurialis annua TaxID=3986 RepID=UPI002160C742|nr:uncharacterized protein LOC126668351 [Mercurialis annua]
MNIDTPELLLREKKAQKPRENLETIELTEGSEMCVKLGVDWPNEHREAIIARIKQYVEEFTNKPEDIGGVDPKIISHKLNVDAKCKQKKRTFSLEKQIAIRDEVEKLLKAGFIRKVDYPEWLANVVLIKKSNGRWRLCIDFTDLNNACPKDSFPLPNIDQLVDATCGFAVYAFLDASQGYHQIPMNKDDEEKTAFTMDLGTYCYKKMPFGLKNVGATYQRLMNHVFKDQLGKNVEVYVDDIVVKSKRIEDHAGDLAETFKKLKGFNLKLNPEKCVFAVRSGKFLGHLISEKGIEANPEKIEAVMDMKAPSSVKEVQKLNGRVTALGSTPPVLGRAEPGEILYLYLSVNDETAAAVLVKEDKGLQTPIYYLSRVLKGPEVRYPKIEKFALALKVAAPKLRRYFEAHIIVVRTNQPLRKALQRPEMSGRLVSWSVQLGGYDIRYEPRPALKAQVLADFIAETTASNQPEEPDEQLLRWVLEVDGASNLEGSGADVVLKGPHGVTLRSSVKFDFPASNNAAEYEALLIGLRMVNVVKAEHVTIRSDSQLVVCQILGTFEARDPEMRRYVDRVKFFLNKIQELGGKWVIEQVPRLENQEADVLAKAATVNEKIPGVHFSIQKHSSIDNHETIFLTQTLENWMQGIAHYLMDGTLPENRDKAYKILRQAPYYAFLDGVLYRKSFTHPWSRCLTAEEGEYVLREIHEGICGAHIDPRMLAKKAVLQGYYWPLMVRQAEEIVKKCENCQRHQNIRHAPTTEQCPITKAVSTITEARIRDFFWRQIVCRFGIPRALVTDNGKQFNCRAFKEFCNDLHIDMRFTSVVHPQSNGMTEVTNRTILKGLKARLGEFDKQWLEELPKVIWAYRTTPRAGTGDTPFSLTYGCEAMIPVEIGMPTLRVQFFDEAKNEEEQKLCLDLLEERREQAALRIEAYKQRITKYHNKRVKPLSFQVGDLVLRRADIAKGNAGVGKLEPNWEGPYRVIEVGRAGAYKIAHMSGRAIRHLRATCHPQAGYHLRAIWTPSKDNPGLSRVSSAHTEQLD